MKQTLGIILICLTPCAAQTRYDRLAARYEVHPTEATYQQLMREWHRVDKHNRRTEQRLKPVTQNLRPSAVRFCDSDYDLRKMIGHE